MQKMHSYAWCVLLGIYLQRYTLYSTGISPIIEIFPWRRKQERCCFIGALPLWYTTKVGGNMMLKSNRWLKIPHLLNMDWINMISIIFFSSFLFIYHNDWWWQIQFVYTKEKSWLNLLHCLSSKWCNSWWNDRKVSI